MSNDSKPPNAETEKKVKAVIASANALDIEDRYDALMAIVHGMNEEDRLEFFSDLESEYCFGCGEHEADHGLEECPELDDAEGEDEKDPPPSAERPS